jgi:hypothetical protein
MFSSFHASRHSKAVRKRFALRTKAGAYLEKLVLFTATRQASASSCHYNHAIVFQLRPAIAYFGGPAFGILAPQPTGPFQLLPRLDILARLLAPHFVHSLGHLALSEIIYRFE